jgi:hypothetical protein
LTDEVDSRSNPVVVPAVDVSKVELIILSYVVERELDRDSVDSEEIADDCV